MSPEEVLEWIEKSWLDGYDMAQAMLLEIASVTDNPDIAVHFRLAAMMLANVKPKDGLRK